MSSKALIIAAVVTLASAQLWPNTTGSNDYAAPKATGTGWEQGFAKATQFLAQLTLAEKALIANGVPGPCIGNIPPITRIGFRGICLHDGPNAVRDAVMSSVFPAGVSVAATWDKDYMRRRGAALGAEFKAKGSHVTLGPVCGPLGRNPSGGRNWEGFSPDPYLTGVAMEESILGIQSEGVQATAKHYIGNEQETQRSPTRSKSGKKIEAQSVNIDDRTMHELYLWPFANSVRAGTASIMCSYQRLNGSYGCESNKALNDLLKGELHFQGYVMSDWGAIKTPSLSITSGTDMAMPRGYEFLATGIGNSTNTTAAGGNATIPLERLNDMVLRIMTPYFQLNQDTNFPSIDPQMSNIGFSQPSSWKYNYNLTGSPRDVRGNHKNIIREGGASGTVLLKNVNGTLPLRQPMHVAVFGNDAGDLTQGLYTLNNPQNGDYEMGTLPMGGGSGAGRFSYLVSPLEAIKARVNGYEGLVSYFLDNKVLLANRGLANVAPTPPNVCLVFLKSWVAEGKDRASLRTDWNGTELVERVATYCNNTVVVTHSGGVNVLPFASNRNVTAILAAHYPGQESGNSIVDILYGDVNPSGRLPYTIPLRESDYNVDIENSTALLRTEDPNAWQTNFDEGLMIDYRYFDSANKSVLYEFGYGLSYTTFSLVDLSVAKATTTNISSIAPRGRVAPGGLPSLWDVLYTVRARVANTGSVDGSAVVQLYIGLNGAPAGTPIQQLRGFEKLELQSRQIETVSFSLMRRDLSYWDTKSQQWLIPLGKIDISVGFSSRDIKLRSTISI